MEQRVYLDDLRRAPHGWIQTETAEETITLLKEGNVVELSLDYNLGPFAQTGATVLEWIDRQVVIAPEWQLPKVIHIHSSHHRGRLYMEDLLDGIKQRLKAAGREAPRTTW